MRRLKKYSTESRDCACGCGLHTSRYSGSSRAYRLYASRECSLRAYEMRRPRTDAFLERRRTTSLRWFRSNRGECSGYRGRTTNDPDRAREAKRKRWAGALWKKFGISPGEFHRMLVAQSGLCPVCDSDMKNPHVDHDHETGAIRGLLCSRCNKAIGQFDDDQQLLINAIRYLGDARRNSLKLA